MKGSGDGVAASMSKLMLTSSSKDDTSSPPIAGSGDDVAPQNLIDGVSGMSAQKIIMDRFSDLSDDLKVKILSSLTMKEAGQTSVLSKKWRYIWAYIPVLNFDAYDTLYKIMLKVKSIEEEEQRYLRWVNQVVRSYKGESIDEFKVRFDIAVRRKYNLDNWINFAMKKRVKKLDLKLDPCCRRYHEKSFVLHGLVISNSLTSLQLHSVDVTGEVLQKFLKACHNLESLSVQRSNSLITLEVSGVPNLKHLEIGFCFVVYCIEVSAPNLISFKYYGPEIRMPLKNTPKLATLFIGGLYCRYMTNNFLEFQSYLLQLEELSLDLPSGVLFAMKSIDQFPLCERLKQLELVLNPLEHENLFCYAPLIKACPLVQKFVLKLKWGGSPPCSRCSHKKAPEKLAFQPEQLKIIEIIGFVGNEIDMEFIIYLMTICVALEKIVINSHEISLVGTLSEFVVAREKRTFAKQVETLRAQLKPGVELIFL